MPSTSRVRRFATETADDAIAILTPATPSTTAEGIAVADTTTAAATANAYIVADITARFTSATTTASDFTTVTTIMPIAMSVEVS